jgi:hypothetical protein
MKAFMKSNAVYRQTKPNQAGSAAGGLAGYVSDKLLLLSGSPVRFVSGHLAAVSE